jgi:hypothetical protein
VFKATALIGAYAGIDERFGAVEKMVDTFLLIEIFNYCRIFSG